ncbi:MAG: hypothetical protein LBT22_08960 [Peptococcaceae bacterium]|nr:hypothetical protein [Peptococcaceae bacterium]
MKKSWSMLRLVVITVILGTLFSACTPQDLEKMELISMSDTDYSRILQIQWDGKVYSGFANFANASGLKRGKQIGYFEDDKYAKVYELQGYDPGDWLILYLWHGEFALYKADGVSGAPEELAALRNR